MTYPGNVVTRQVIGNVPTTLTSNVDYTLAQVRLIVGCNQGPLINIASGTILFDRPHVVFNTLTLLLPLTDQVGIWADEEGRVLNTNPTHTYRIDMEYLDQQNNWKFLRSWKELKVPAGGGALDLDTVYNTDTQYTVTG